MPEGLQMDVFANGRGCATSPIGWGVSLFKFIYGEYS